DKMSLMHVADGTATAAFLSKIDIDGHRYGLGVSLRPRGNIQDPRWNTPAPCVLYRGGTDKDQHHEIVVDAQCFGIAKMSCAACTYAAVVIDWDAIYNWL